MDDNFLLQAYCERRDEAAFVQKLSGMDRKIADVFANKVIEEDPAMSDALKAIRK